MAPLAPLVREELAPVSQGDRPVGDGRVAQLSLLPMVIRYRASMSTPESVPW